MCLSLSPCDLHMNTRDFVNLTSGKYKIDLLPHPWTHHFPLLSCKLIMIRSFQTINPENKEISCCLAQWHTPVVLAMKKPRLSLMNLRSSYGLDKKILPKHVMKKKKGRKEWREGRREWRQGKGSEKGREEGDKETRRKKCWETMNSFFLFNC